MDNADIRVSICCITYNHAGYIRQTLDGFIDQSTDFAFEVLVHDDCSTDGTREIIEEYARLHPSVIIPLYEEENRWSEVRKYTASFLLPIARGDYIALCEGDDFWTDPLKLQKQFNYMELHPEVSLLTHREAILTPDGLFSRDEILCKLPAEEKDFTTSEIIICGGELFATASMFFKTESANELPDWYWTAPVGDYPLCIWLSLAGTVHYMPDEMCVYRFMSQGSWSARNDASRSGKINLELIEMLDSINTYTKGAYSEAISATICKHISSIYSKRDMKALSAPIVKKHRKILPLSLRLRIRLLAFVAFMGYSIERRGGRLDVYRIDTRQ